MTKEKSKVPLDKKDILAALSALRELRYPGLTPGFREIPGLAGKLTDFLPVIVYKEGRSSVWAVLLGGTGTGKSSVFNALCGAQLSASGVERPKTSGAIGYCHEDEKIEEDFPLPLIDPVLIPLDKVSGPLKGSRGIFQAVQHSSDDLRHLVLVDTPDVDSLEPYNRMTAERFSFLADVVVFITSQEKYADEAPYQLLKREIAEEKPCFLIVNKVSEDITLDEVSQVLSLKDVPSERLVIGLLPYLPGDPARELSDQDAVRDLKAFLLDRARPEAGSSLLLQRRELNRRKALEALGEVIRLLSQERQESEEWNKKLQELSSKASDAIVSLEEKRFASESRQYINTQIRALFERYDLLARPRKLVREVILFPLKMLGVIKDRVTGSRDEILARMKKKGPSAPARETIEGLNRSVLRDLSPKDEDAPLYRAMRVEGLRLDERELEELISRQNERLLSRLEEAFSRLSQGLPGVKKWGIYTTSILWGVLILALETVVGGGFTVLDAILGSALAPFVTKGATELFATHEIRNIARELAGLHKEGLLSIVEEQRRRYAESLERLAPSPDTMQVLKRLEERLLQKA